jgi:hypothetical protein
MVPVPFRVVPTAVGTLLPAFLQVLEAAVGSIVAAT